jgi:uncharacterized membrane protein YeiB
MQQMIYGAIIMGYAVAALFFLRFWRQTHDRLFALFAVAFAIFAANRIVLTALAEDSEGRTIVYVFRALAFAVIAYAVIDKNRARA